MLCSFIVFFFTVIVFVLCCNFSDKIFIVNKDLLFTRLCGLHRVFHSISAEGWLSLDQTARCSFMLLISVNAVFTREFSTLSESVHSFPPNVYNYCIKIVETFSSSYYSEDYATDSEFVCISVDAFCYCACTKEYRMMITLSIGESQA